jgi:hypothetical protein
MTRFTPLWQQAGSYSAQVDRSLLNTLWPVPAAVGAIPTTVSNTMNVSIPPGTIAVPLQAGQNTALCRWDAAEVVTSPAAPASGNTRIDVVVCQVRDPQLDAGVNNDFVFLVIAGTPSTGTPVAPAVPNNAAAVCQYTVPAAVVNLNGVTIVDRRRGNGLQPVFASTAERDAIWPNPPEGAEAWTTDGGIGWRFNSGQWRAMTALSRYMNAFNASEVTVGTTPTTICSVTAAVYHPPGTYTIVALGQTWTTVIFTVTLRKNGSVFASTTHQSVSDYATFGIASVTQVAVGDVLSLSMSGSGVGGCRVGANLVATLVGY